MKLESWRQVVVMTPVIVIGFVPSYSAPNEDGDTEVRPAQPRQNPAPAQQPRIQPKQPPAAGGNRGAFGQKTD